MLTSALVTPQHRQKKALISIRQSTPHQPISNQESLRLQYALHERAQRSRQGITFGMRGRM
jgi:hypothetical protein